MILDRAIATAPAIVKYLRDVSKRHGIDKHIKYQHKVVELDWQTDLQKWKVEVRVNDSENRTYFSRFVAAGSGYYDYNEVRNPDTHYAFDDTDQKWYTGTSIDYPWAREFQRSNSSSTVLARGP